MKSDNSPSGEFWNSRIAINTVGTWLLCNCLFAGVSLQLELNILLMVFAISPRRVIKGFPLSIITRNESETVRVRLSRFSVYKPERSTCPERELGLPSNCVCGDTSICFIRCCRKLRTMLHWWESAETKISTSSSRCSLGNSCEGQTEIRLNETLFHWCIQRHFPQPMYHCSPYRLRAERTGFRNLPPRQTPFQILWRLMVRSRRGGTWLISRG